MVHGFLDVSFPLFHRDFVYYDIPAPTEENYSLVSNIFYVPNEYIPVLVSAALTEMPSRPAQGWKSLSAVQWRHIYTSGTGTLSSCNEHPYSHLSTAQLPTVSKPCDISVSINRSCPSFRVG